MWQRESVPKHLPVHSGPFVPGCTDLMLGYGKDGLFMRLYYPTDSEENPRKWIPWVQLYEYLPGISKLLSTSLRFLRFASWLYGAYNSNQKGSIHIPCVYGEKPSIKNKLKCIIMSHGMGATRFFYSKVCYELASYGFLIIALEHRDLSSCYTYYYKNESDVSTNTKSGLYYKHFRFGDNHYVKRNDQVKRRSQECYRVVEILKQINEGLLPEDVLKENVDFRLDDLIGNLDLDNLIMMGHSFGGATALNVVANKPEFKCCVLLDPWMFPIKDEDLHLKISIPLLFVNTETFHIGSNVKSMSKFLKNGQNEMYTLKRTTHEAQTDSVLIFGSWLNWSMRKLNPTTAMNINNRLVLKFLNKHVNFPVNIIEEEKYLEENKENVLYGLTKAWM